MENSKYSFRSDSMQRLFVSHTDSSAKAESETEVWIKRLFPESHPASFISLLQADSKEFMLIENLEVLSPENYKVLTEHLEGVDQGIRILKVEDILEESELRVYHVTSHVGPRRFVTKNDEWPQPKAQGGYQILDLYGDLYEFPELDKLDDSSKKLLWSLVDTEIK
jgi:hypothetical protein